MKTILTFLSMFLLTNSYAQCYTTVKSHNGTIIARMTDGTLWAKGANNNGISGNGTTAHITNFIQIGTDNDWSDNFSMSSSHVLAIKNNGTLWAWGRNSYGSCGFGLADTGVYYEPTQVGTDNHWTFLAAGTSHSLAVKSDGTLWSWGANEYGQLGIGASSDTQRLVPMQVGSETHWQKVFSNGYNYAIKMDGTLWIWGAGSATAPAQLGTDADWDMISTALSFSIGLKINHTLWAWGSSAGSLFGNGAPSGQGSSSSYPIQLGTDSDWKQITVSYNSCLALKNNGTRWGWGLNSTTFALGDGTMTSWTYPTQLDTASDWNYTAIDTESGPGVAIKQDNSLYQWGHISNFPGVITVPTLQGNVCLLSTNSFEETAAIKIFPNPTANNVSINYNLKESGTVRISITDCLGQLVYDTIVIGKANENEQQINMSNFASGVYFIKMQTGSKSFCGKIIKN